MSRPDKLPSWADDDDPLKVVEPSGAKKLQGWLYKERPAFQFWNWVFRNFVKWILHLDESSNQFDPSEQSTPNMTVALTAGRIQNGTALVNVAAQSTPTIVAPSGNPRIDRVVVNNSTGVASVITGTENASPVAPVLTSGSIAICQVLLDNSPATTAITNSLVTDERAVNKSGYIKVSGGVISSTGAILSNPMTGVATQSGGLSSSRLALGQYRLTHNFNSLNYSAIASSRGSSVLITRTFNVDLNSVDFLVSNLSGTSADSELHFVINNW